ncbi:MAG: hypothetical protein QXT22_05830 [Candidatus Hadarchaeales archaeon]
MEPQEIKKIEKHLPFEVMEGGPQFHQKSLEKSAQLSQILSEEKFWNSSTRGHSGRKSLSLE